MTWYDLKIEIINILEGGKWPNGHKRGEEFIWSKDRGKNCGNACYTLYHILPVFNLVEVFRGNGYRILYSSLS